MSNLGGAAARGAAVTLAGQGARLVIQLVSLIVLARLLPPSAFGLVAMAMVFVGVSEIVRDFGMSNAAIQAPQLSRQQRTNLFWISTGIGIGLGASMAAAAPLIAALYTEPRLTPIAQGLAIALVLNSLTAQHRASLARDLRFGALTIVETIPVAIGAAVAIGLAANGYGVASLVWQQIVQSSLAVALAFTFARWAPGLPRRTPGMRPLVMYGANLLGAQLVAFASRNVDTVVLGMRFSPSAVGVYTRSYELVMNPLNQINAPSSKVAIPVLSRLQTDPARYNAFLLRGQLLILIGVAPALILLAVAAKPVVELVLGPGWVAAAPYVALLSLAGLARVAAYPTYWIALSKGFTNLSLQVNLFSAPLYVACIIAGSVLGPIGVAIGFLAASFGAWGVALIIYGKRAGAPSLLLLVGAIKVIGACLPGCGTVAIILSAWTDAPPAAILAVSVGAFLLATGTVYGSIPTYRRDFRLVVHTVRMLRRS